MLLVLLGEPDPLSLQSYSAVSGLRAHRVPHPNRPFRTEHNRLRADAAQLAKSDSRRGMNQSTTATMAASAAISAGIGRCRVETTRCQVPFWTCHGLDQGDLPESEILSRSWATL